MRAFLKIYSLEKVLPYLHLAFESVLKTPSCCSSRRSPKIGPRFRFRGARAPRRGAAAPQGVRVPQTGEKRNPGSAFFPNLELRNPGSALRSQGSASRRPVLRVRRPSLRHAEPGFRGVRRPVLRWPGFRNFPVRAPLSGPSARAGFVRPAHPTPPRGTSLAASEPAELGRNISGPGVGNGMPVFRVRGARVPRRGTRKFPK